MLPEPIKLTPVSIEKVRQIVKRMHYDAGKVMAKTMLLGAASVVPIAYISYLTGLLETSFPFIAGIFTGLMIHFTYTVPRIRTIGEKASAEIKEVIKTQEDPEAKLPTQEG